MNLLQTVGVMALVFGMQITFEAEPRAEFVSLVDGYEKVCRWAMARKSWVV